MHRRVWVMGMALMTAACASHAGAPTEGTVREDGAAPTPDGSFDSASPGADAGADSSVDATRTDGAPRADAPEADTAPSADGEAPDARPPPSDEGAADAPADTALPDGANPQPDAQPPSTCNDGSPVLYTRTACTGTPPPPPSALVSAIPGATRGDVVSLGSFDEPAAPCVSLLVCTKTGAPTMLFSDDPESPSSDGILYADVIGPGAFRVYVYHTNGGSGSRKFTVVALNEGSNDVRATVGPKGIAGPGNDYVAIGKTAIQAWLSDTTTSSVVVPAGQRVVFDSDLDGIATQSFELAHAIIDFTLDGPVKMSVVSVLSSENAATVTAGLPLLPNDQLHQRGTFPGAARVLQAQAAIDATGVRRLTLGDGSFDENLTGEDAVDGTPVSLAGNYGLVYDLLLPVSSDMAFIAAPQGGAWGGGATLPAGADGPAGVTLLPSAMSSLGSQTEAIFLGSFTGQTTVMATLLSAGGSSLPIDVASVPVP